VEKIKRNREREREGKKKVVPLEEKNRWIARGITQGGGRRWYRRREKVVSCVAQWSNFLELHARTKQQRKEKRKEKERGQRGGTNILNCCTRQRNKKKKI
jgi:hypothetical protein